MLGAFLLLSEVVTISCMEVCGVWLASAVTLHPVIQNEESYGEKKGAGGHGPGLSMLSMVHGRHSGDFSAWSMGNEAV